MKAEIRGEAPCITACPINQDARDYVQLIARGHFEEAFQLVRSKNPFPASCGRICTRRCEEACRRTAVDEPIAICWLKRFLSDKDFTSSFTIPQRGYAEKVAIVGAGPAGLSAANDLCLLGYRCVIFEELQEPGGMLRVGVPRYRLPRESLDKDIANILSLGAELRTEIKVGVDITLADLQKEDFKAVFLAIGSHKPLRLGIPGEDLPGVIPALEFFRKVSLGGGPRVGRRVAVVGGGDTALDAARTALRTGAGEVSLIYRRGLEEMPCETEGRKEAEEEGINFILLAAPVEVLGKNRVMGLRCIRMTLGEPDTGGRRRPVPLPGSEFALAVDNVLVAVGQSPELGLLARNGIEISQKGAIKVDEDTMLTNVPWVFAGGDAIALGGTLVQAIAHGRRAALSIHSYLRGERFQSPVALEPIEELSPAKTSLIKREVRQRMPMLPVAPRIKDFNEVELGFPEEQAVREARRCLNCGAGAVVDPELCAACLTCVRVCPYDVPQISLGGKRAEIGSDCQSCGVCAVECPANAISLRDRYEDMGEKTLESVMGQLPGRGVSQYAPTIVAFVCQYDSNPPAVAQELRRNGVRAVEVSCISKLEPSTFVKAFEMGADAVLIVGCQPGGCHFDAGHAWAKRRLDHTARLLETMGVERQRLQWISPIPEEEFFKILRDSMEEIKKLGPVFQTNK
ncbi:MAG: FAD-dependent oxidoreductase [Candidatus Brocadiaceae bacterium]|nr:FAD-dependent oxidoreductase [Candidatus Brocadiaceae bacterium]